MRLWSLCLTAIATGLFGAAHAQSLSSPAEGWAYIGGTNPAYVHQGTLFRCPESLGDGYVITSTFTANEVNEFACAYRRGEEGTISFHWAQALETIAEEINNKERTYWSEIMPGVAPVPSERTWTIGGETIKATTSQVAQVAPATLKLLGLSLSIGTAADRRIKANELWLESQAISNRVTASFFALQTDAVTNRKNCLSHGLWPARQPARLSPNPSESASTAALLLLAKTIAESDSQAGPAPAPRICQGIYGSTAAQDASLLSQRTGVQDLRAVMSNGAAGDVVAALGARPKESIQKIDRESPYYLYGKQGKLLAIFRSYRALPSYPQLAADMVAVAAGQLEPIAVISANIDAGQVDVSIDSAQANAEKAKRRLGSK